MANGMGYFWCSCDPHVAHVLRSLLEHITAEAGRRGAEAVLAAVEAVRAGDQRAVGKMLAAARAAAEQTGGGK
jgi:hypothetical protein